MINRETRLIFYILLSGFFLFLDQLLKYTARVNHDYQYYLIDTYLGWEYFGNTGIAFSIPFSNSLLLFATPIIIFLLFYTIVYKKRSELFIIGIFLIIFGAISNLIDRFLFEITVDYIRFIFWVLNLADIMIVTGALLLILDELLKNNPKK